MLEPLLARLEDGARTALEIGLTRAGECGDQFFGTEHLLLGVLAEPSTRVAQTLRSIACDPELLRAELLASMRCAPPLTSQAHVPFTPKVLNVLAAANDAARELGAERIAVEHLLLGMLGEPTTLAGRALAACNVEREKVLAALRARR